MVATAQSGSWKIRINGKVVLSTSVENEDKNVRSISSSDWNSQGKLEISFKDNEPNGWKRTFHFYDENDNEIQVMDSVNFYSIKLTDLHKLLEGKRQLRIFTTVTPLDPNIAVRIRRVHLCTLRLP